MKMKMGAKMPRYSRKKAAIYIQIYRNHPKFLLPKAAQIRDRFKTSPLSS